MPRTITTKTLNKANVSKLIFAEFNGLKDKVKELRRNLAGQSKTIFVKNLPFNKIKLTEYIPLLIEKQSQGYIVSNSDLDMFGEGETEFDAIKDFALSLEELYFDLKREKIKNLGEYPKLIFNFLKEIVKRK